MTKFWFKQILIAGAIVTLIGISAQAKKEDGHYQKAQRYLEYRQPRSACSTLASAIDLSRTICEGQRPDQFKQKLESSNPDQYANLNLLGVALRQIGYYDLARDVLKAAKLQAKTDEESDSTSMSLGNVSQGEYQRALNQYIASGNRDKKDIATETLSAAAQDAVKQYQTLWSSKSTSVQIKARLNWLLITSSFDKSEFPELQELQSTSQIDKVIQDLIEQITNLAAQEQIEARIKFAESLRKLSNENKSYIIEAQRQVQLALKLAQRQRNAIAESRAIGLSGRIFLQDLQVQQATTAFEQAQNLAVANHSLDLAYQWQWELGKIYVKTNDKRASQEYKAAVDSLNKLRKNLITINPELQLGFQEQVEPLYKEYLELLFKNQQPDLKEIIQVNEQLQITELENYLQCSQLQVSSLLNLSPQESPDAAIYIIRLPNKYELIVRLKDGKLIHRSANLKVVDSDLDKIRQNLTSEQLDNLDSGGFQTLFGNLYNSLFSSIKNLLPDRGTIIFTGNSELQSIPWGVLYDGNQYLIERYSIAYTLGIDAQAPKSINNKKLSIFAAGMSNFSGKTTFADLEFVPEEIEGIKAIVKNSKSLLDNKFTTEQLFFNAPSFPIIHLATHGQFSSNPNESYILNWDGKLSMSEIRKLVKGNESSKVPQLELLVLSACESAKGDKRAALGLAGSAIQAGARSTIASQWVINDRSQADLMIKFYQELKDGKSKAEALRQAQLSILQSNTLNTKFSNPYYWAMNILIGSWL